MRVLLDTTIYKRAPGGGGLRYLNELADRLPDRTGISVDLVPYGRPSQATLSGSVPPLIKSDATISRTGSARPAALAALRNTLRPAKMALEQTYWKFRYLSARDTIFHLLFHHRFAEIRVPMVATIHDMIFEIFTDMYTGAHWDVERNSKASAAHNAVRCIAISEQTKSDLCNIYGISPGNVDVIYHGVNTEDFNRNRAPGEDGFLRQSGLDGVPYLLYVGGRANHKNFSRLLRAYAGSAISKELLLVVTGSSWHADEQRLMQQLGVKAQVRLLQNPCTSQLAPYIGTRQYSFILRCMKGSACQYSKRWPVAPPSRFPRPDHCRKSGAMQRSISIRATSGQ